MSDFNVSIIRAFFLAASLAFGIPQAGAESSIGGIMLQSPIVLVEPPHQRYEVLEPRDGYIIQNGYWNFNFSTNQYDWTPAQYRLHRPGYTFRQFEWKHNNGRYELQRGGFELNHRNVNMEERHNHYDFNGQDQNRR